MLLFTISFLLNLLIAASNAPPKCNGTILLNHTDTYPTTHTIKNGYNSSFPGFDSNKVFLLEISKRSKNRLVIMLDDEYYITGIGIRQRFSDSEVGMDLCPSSLIYDPVAHFKITYDHSKATNLSLDYPPGTEKGLIVPDLLFPTQAFGSDYGKENKLRVAINATKMKSISIEKKAFAVDNILLNPGTFCVQFELYGCSVTTEITQLRRGIVLEYQFVEPYMWDETYSGLCSGGVCTGGVGRLTDNEIDAITGTPNSFVIWDLNGTEYSNASNVDQSSIRILIILNDVYFIENVKVIGISSIGSETYAVPCMTMVNGAYSSSIYPTTEDFYEIPFYPLIFANSLFLEFFIDDMESSSKIALAEIIVSAHPVTTDNIPQACTVWIIAYSLVVSVVVVFLLLSLGLNFYFFIRSKSIPSNFNLPRFSLTPMHRISETNHYLHRRHVDNQPDYESVDMSDRALPNPPEPEPETESEPESDPFQTPTPLSETEEDKTTLFRSLGSVVQMAPNPTYVTSLSTLEEIRDYSHLDFSEHRGNSVPEQEDMSAKERRVSFSEQQNLSDLK